MSQSLSTVKLISSLLLRNKKGKINEVCRNHLPSGSGFNNGTNLDFDKSNPERLVFITAFHHMNGGGFYDGWTHHEVIVTPSLNTDFHLRVTGRNRNDIKDYIAETYHSCLDTEIEEIEND